MTTNATIHDLLHKGVASAEARALTAKHDIHELAPKLKELYERVYGRVKADMQDWHWQATSLKNRVRYEDAQKATKTGADTVSTDGATKGLVTAPAPNSAAANTAGSPSQPISGHAGNPMSAGSPITTDAHHPASTVTPTPGSPSVAGEVGSYDSNFKATTPGASAPPPALHKRDDDHPVDLPAEQVGESRMGENASGVIGEDGQSPSRDFGKTPPKT